MTITREERSPSQMLLAALGLEAWPSLLEELEALGPKAIACFKTDTGYELVSAPSGANKKWQARTSGKPCGQRGLGSFTSAEAAAIEVFRWIVGIKPTPPTPGRIKSRSKRGEGKRQLDRCNHGRGAPFFTPSGRAHLSQLGPTLTGGPDLRGHDDGVMMEMSRIGRRREGRVFSRTGRARRSGRWSRRASPSSSSGPAPPPRSTSRAGRPRRSSRRWCATPPSCSACPGRRARLCRAGDRRADARRADAYSAERGT